MKRKVGRPRKVVDGEQSTSSSMPLVRESSNNMENEVNVAGSEV